MSGNNTVGAMRAQAALVDADERIAIVSADPGIRALGLVVVRTYPDTTNEAGEWKPTFKIEVGRAAKAGTL